MQIFSLRWVNWLIYLCVLFVLLLCSLRYVWVYANIIFLWLHGLCLLWLLPDAWKCRLSSRFAFCPPHISIHQVRVVLELIAQYWETSYVSSTFHIHRFLCRKGTCSSFLSFFGEMSWKGNSNFIRYYALRAEQRGGRWMSVPGTNLGNSLYHYISPNTNTFVLIWSLSNTLLFFLSLALKFQHPFMTKTRPWIEFVWLATFSNNIKLYINY